MHYTECITMIINVLRPHFTTCRKRVATECTEFW